MDGFVFFSFISTLIWIIKHFKLLWLSKICKAQENRFLCRWLFQGFVNLSENESLFFFIQLAKAGIMPSNIISSSSSEYYNTKRKITPRTFLKGYFFKLCQVTEELSLKRLQATFFFRFVLILHQAIKHYHSPFPASLHFINQIILRTYLSYNRNLLFLYLIEYYQNIFI